MGLRPRRITVLVLTVGLMAGAWRPCAGSAPTADARMSCCSGKTSCAMRKKPRHGAHRAVSQSEADACCAAAERPPTSQTPMTVVLAPALLPVSDLFAPEPSVPARWVDFGRPPPLLASRRVPRHLLLSVFVI